MRIYKALSAYKKTVSPLTFRLTVAAFLLPFALLPFYIAHFGVSTPYSDEWSLVPDLRKFLSGTLTFGDLFALHNEHRLFFPKLFLLPLIAVTGFNTKASMFVTGLMFMATLGAIISVYLKRFAKAESAAYLPLFSFTLLSLGQYENLLYGFQTTFILPALTGVLAFYFIEKANTPDETSPSAAALAAAAVCATIASFSSAMGLLVWVIGAAQLAANTGLKKWKFLLVWSVIGAAQWLLYFHGYAKPDASPSMLAALHTPVRYAVFLLTMLGNVIVTLKLPALAAGTGATLAAFWGARRLRGELRFKDISFWLALMGYGLCTAGIIALGRCGFGLGQALASRYTSFTALIYIGLLGILLEMSVNRGNAFAAKLKNALVILLASAALWNTLYGCRAGAYAHYLTSRSAYLTEHYKTVPDSALLPQYKLYSAYLQSIRFSRFANSARTEQKPRPEPGPAQAAFSADGLTVLAEGPGYLAITGWALDHRSSRPARAVAVQIDDTVYPAFYGSPCTGQFVRLCGFEKYLPLDALEDGPHIATLRVTGQNNTCRISDQPLAFTKSGSTIALK